MRQVLHGNAKTAEAARREIQNSQKRLEVLSNSYSFNKKTVVKWRKRIDVKDAPVEPKVKRSTTLSLEKEAAIVAFRKYTLLSLDDYLYALQNSIPHLNPFIFTSLFTTP